MMKYITLTLAMMMSVVFYGQAQDYTKKMTDYMNAWGNLGQFSGNVVVVKDGRTVFEKGYGKANIELNVDMNRSYAFRSGTLTQQFVAYAALKMYGTGKLDINNPISYYLPEYRKDVGQKVKVIDLLMQTSGLPDFIMNPNYLGDKSCYPMSKAEFIKKFCSDDTHFEPGSKSEQSSTNYYLLGVILERQTNQSLAVVLDQYVFQPLGMSSAGVETGDKMAKGLMSGYSRSDVGAIIDAGYINLDLVGGAGAVYLNIGDLQKWGAANKAESEENKKMQSLAGSRSAGLAFGWVNDQAFDHKRKGAIGLMKGFSAAIDLYPNDNLQIYIMSNYEFAPVDRIRRDLAAIMFGKSYVIPGQAPTAVKLSATQLKPFEGTFKMQMESNPMTIYIKLKDDKLFVGQNLSEMDELIPISEEEFYMSSKPESRLKFEKSGSKVTGFMLYLSDASVKFIKQ